MPDHAEDVASLAARTAIADVVAAYTRAGDAGRIDEVVGCFAPGGVLQVKNATHRGPEEIAAFIRDVGRRFSAAPAFLPARHHLATAWVELSGSDEASGGAYFSLVAANGIDHWGSYRDSYIKIDARWCFADRRVRIEGARAGSPVAEMVE